MQNKNPEKERRSMDIIPWAKKSEICLGSRYIKACLLSTEENSRSFLDGMIVAVYTVHIEPFTVYLTHIYITQ